MGSCPGPSGTFHWPGFGAWVVHTRLDAPRGLDDLDSVADLEALQAWFVEHAASYSQKGMLRGQLLELRMVLVSIGTPSSDPPARSRCRLATAGVSSSAPQPRSRKVADLGPPN